MIFPIVERVEIIKLFYRSNDNARVTATLIDEGHPEQNLSDINAILDR